MNKNATDASGSPAQSVSTPHIGGLRFWSDDVSDLVLDPAFDRALRQHMMALGIKPLGPNNRLITAEALRRGVDVSGTRAGRVRLSHGGVTYWYRNGATNLNSLLARKLSSQKQVSSAVIRSQGLNAPENAVFAADEALRAWRWAEPLTPVVVKPTNASQGRGVHLNITLREEFCGAYDSVAKEYGRVLVEQQHTGSEHRVYVIDGRMVAALRQIPANVVGNGRASVRTLVELKNTNVAAPHKKITLGPFETTKLYRQGLTPHDVPEAGRRVYLRETSNLSSGADSIDATDEITVEESQYISDVAACWPSLRSAGYDILLPRDGSRTEPVVIEINHASSLGGHHLPRIGASRNVARAILDSMFPSQRI